ncbi:MAG: hypothetical protein KHZ62_10455 [Clostridiales bacterium]|nr:hypothetical protein [Clostridiales bacterium]
MRQGRERCFPKGENAEEKATLSVFSGCAVNSRPTVIYSFLGWKNLEGESFETLSTNKRMVIVRSKKPFVFVPYFRWRATGR